MVHRRVGADDDDDLGIQCRGEGRGYGAGVEALHQSRYGAGVAEPGTVVHVVVAEAGADQLLEQVGLLVRSLSRAEARQALRSPRRLDAVEAAGGKVQRLLPGCLAEVGPGVRRVHLVLGVLGGVGQADQRLGEPVRVVDVVEAEAALDAEPVLVGRAVAALGIDDAVVLDLVGHLAADAAIRVQAVHLAVRPGHALFRLVQVGGRHPVPGLARQPGRRVRHLRPDRPSDDRGPKHHSAECAYAQQEK